MQGAPAILHQPQPLEDFVRLRTKSHKKGLQPLPKPLANLSCVPLVASDQRSSGQGDVIDYGQGPPYVKVLVSLAKPVP